MAELSLVEEIQLLINLGVDPTVAATTVNLERTRRSSAPERWWQTEWPAWLYGCFPHLLLLFILCFHRFNYNGSPPKKEQTKSEIGLNEYSSNVIHGESFRVYIIEGCLLFAAARLLFSDKRFLRFKIIKKTPYFFGFFVVMMAFHNFVHSK